MSVRVSVSECVVLAVTCASVSECELAIKSWQSHVELEFGEEVVIEDIDMNTNELSAHELIYVRCEFCELYRFSEHMNNPHVVE